MSIHICQSPCTATSSLRHQTYVPLPSTLLQPFVQRSPIYYMAFQAFRMDTEFTRSILVVFGRVFRATISRGGRKKDIKRLYIGVQKGNLVSPHHCDLKDPLLLKEHLLLVVSRHQARRRLRSVIADLVVSRRTRLDRRPTL